MPLWLCACALPAPPGDAEPAPPPAVPQAHPQLAAQLLADANRARAQAELQPLAAMRELDSAAELYARELAQRGVLEHSSPTPGLGTMMERIDAAGVVVTEAAENLFSYEGNMTDLVGRRAVAAWLASPGHRTNLLNPAFTHSGVGIARSTSGTWYVVQLYALPGPVRPRRSN